MTPIKFYPNHPDNMHCSQAVFCSVFNYFFDEELSWEEIDKITRTVPGRGSWTMSAYIELARRGVEIINIEPFDYQEFAKSGVNYLNATFFKETVEWYLNKSNLMSVKDLIPAFLRFVKHDTRRASIEDIDRMLDQGYLIGAEINSRVLNHLPGFSLHYVLVKKKVGQKYLINDPGGGSTPGIEA